MAGRAAGGARITRVEGGLDSRARQQDAVSGPDLTTVRSCYINGDPTGDGIG